MELGYILLVFLSVVSYASSSLTLLCSRLLKKEQALLYSYACTAVGFVAQTLALLLAAYQTAQGASLSSYYAHNVLHILAWICVALYLLTRCISRLRPTFKLYAMNYAVVLALCLEFCAWLQSFHAPSEDIMRLYAGWSYLVIHIACYMVSAAFFLLGGISSALALVQQRNLKSRNLKKIQALPDLSSLKKVGRLTILSGMPLYSFGLLLGISRAVMLVPLWFVSPRVLLALALWFVVLLYLFEVYILKAATQLISKTAIALAVMTLLLALLSASIPMFLPVNFLGDS